MHGLFSELWHAKDMVLSIGSFLWVAIQFGVTVDGSPSSMDNWQIYEWIAYILELGNTINTVNSIDNPSISMANGATYRSIAYLYYYSVEFGLLLLWISPLFWNATLPISHGLWSDPWKVFGRVLFTKIHSCRKECQVVMLAIFVRRDAMFVVLCNSK